MQEGEGQVGRDCLIAREGECTICKGEFGMLQIRRNQFMNRSACDRVHFRPLALPIVKSSLEVLSVNDNSSGTFDATTRREAHISRKRKPVGPRMCDVQTSDNPAWAALYPNDHMFVNTGDIVSDVVAVTRNPQR